MPTSGQYGGSTVSFDSGFPAGYELTLTRSEDGTPIIQISTDGVTERDTEGLPYVRVGFNDAELYEHTPTGAPLSVRARYRSLLIPLDGPPKVIDLDLTQPFHLPHNRPDLFGATTPMTMEPIYRTRTGHPPLTQMFAHQRPARVYPPSQATLNEPATRLARWFDVHRPHWPRVTGNALVFGVDDGTPADVAAEVIEMANYIHRQVIEGK